jgi:hypothetical protein
MRKRDQASLDAASLDELVEEITVDANGEDEQLWAFRQAFEDNVSVPCEATVIGEPVKVMKFDYDGNNRRGLTAMCRRADSTTYVVAASDLVIPLSASGGRYLAAYSKWMGLAPLPRGTRGRTGQQTAVAPSDLDGPIELVVLSVKQKSACCRLLGRPNLHVPRSPALGLSARRDRGRTAREAVDLCGQSLSLRPNRVDSA